MLCRVIKLANEEKMAKEAHVKVELSLSELFCFGFSNSYVCFGKYLKTEKVIFLKQIKNYVLGEECLSRPFLVISPPFVFSVAHSLALNFLIFEVFETQKLGD